MKKNSFLVFIFTFAILFSFNFQTEQKNLDMKIKSSAFVYKEKIPSKYTCDGEDINPPLAIAGVPPGAKSLALVMDDPDAPMGTWVHWLVWNISTKTMQIEENSVPDNSTEGKNSWGKSEYGGPCPPFGVHRYFFKLYALDTKLNLPSSADVKMLEAEMKNHIIAKAEWMGTYIKK